MCYLRSLPSLLVACLLLQLACSPSSSEYLEVTPEAPAIQVGATERFSANALKEDLTEPEWHVQELSNGGAILTQSKGKVITYKAPHMAGTYHLVVQASRPDGSKVRQVVEVVVLPTIKIEPSAPVVKPGANINFTATVEGLHKNTVKWSVSPGDGGSITSEGVYAAPRKSGTYQVTATATTDPNASTSVTVRVE